MHTSMNFFDPSSRHSDLFAMGGTGHLVLVLVLFGLLALLILFRKDARRLRESRAFMAGIAALVLSFELVGFCLSFIYPFGLPALERLPLHLCQSLKLAIATLILLRRYDLVKHLAVWAIGAGFISFANLNLEGESFGNFMFWQYLVGHAFLFLVPVLLFLAGEFRYDLRYHARSMLALFAWSLFVFFVNWAADTNFMYMGPHNQTVVAFVPDRLMAWPLSYVAYALGGLVFLSLVFAIMRICQPRMDRGARRDVAAAAAPRPCERWLAKSAVNA